MLLSTNMAASANAYTDVMEALIQHFCMMTYMYVGSSLFSCSRYICHQLYSFCLHRSPALAPETEMVIVTMKQVLSVSTPLPDGLDRMRAEYARVAAANADDSLGIKPPHVFAMAMQDKIVHTLAQRDTDSFQQMLIHAIRIPLNVSPCVALFCVLLLHIAYARVYPFRRSNFSERCQR
jgi:hypothetical protein